MMLFRKYLKRVLFILIFGALLFGKIRAIDVDIPEDLKDDRNLPREERIRRHQKRVELLLEARKKSKEEDQKRKEEEQKARVQEARERVQEAAKTAPAHPSGRSSETRSESAPEALSISPMSSQTMANTILYFFPFDKTVNVGQNFLTDIEVFNLDKKMIEELRLTINFDPSLLKPIYVTDNEINELINGSPEYQTDFTKGEIYYSCQFKTPQTLDDRSLLRLVWTALKPSESTEIGLDLSSEGKTALLYKGKDILGIANTPADGVIPFGLTINSTSRKESGKLLIDPAIQKQLGFLKEERNAVILRMETKSRIVSLGEVFDVSIYLFNSEGENFDNLNLLIKFDPKVLRVVDWDKRNWITQGINIQDGFAHKKYPFDFHLRNDANNFRGSIDYRMGSSRMNPFPTGELAKIRFKAVAPAEKTLILFERSKHPDPPNTSITTMGREKLSTAQWQEEYCQLILQVAQP